MVFRWPLSWQQVELDSFSMKELANQLNNRFQPLTRGCRAALASSPNPHRRARLSYTLLPEQLRGAAPPQRLCGMVHFESAVAVASGDTLPVSDVIGSIADLIAKSFIIADVDGPKACYRLLDTTGALRVPKLNEADEFQLVAHAHANHFRLLFERAESEWETRSTAEWLAGLRSSTR